MIEHLAENLPRALAAERIDLAGLEEALEIRISTVRRT